jgi:hypothetical protein
LNLHTRRADTLTQIVTRRSRGGNDVRFHFETITMHTFRITDPILPVDSKSTLDYMNDFAIIWNGNRTSLVQGMDNVILFDRISIHSHRTAAVHRGNMRACHTD